MDFDTLTPLLALLPGFLTAEIIGALVLREDRSVLDRLIQALIYTFLAHALWGLVGPAFPTGLTATLVGLGTCAVVWGLAFTWIINSGHLHDLLQKWGLTQAASRPNEWYDAFYAKEKYVVLHLRDGRRVFGWPRLYPCRPDRGHILLEYSEWLDRSDDSAASQEVDCLVNVDDVRFVEFVTMHEKEPPDG